uniref:Uncharacterized protein n=1 Tax=Palpitomonas bilix TaxID=652834 RepID=A0A7S3GHD9_9EUKA|mmetsp:Transcript_49394/g.127337  ORF Transcript_49394/g.127337 Transcript_49394/m.127337 type:complete len:108 (+) Transcript_49394:50-373(+)
MMDAARQSTQSLLTASLGHLHEVMGRGFGTDHIDFDYEELDLSTADFFNLMNAKDERDLAEVKKQIRATMDADEFNQMIREYATEELKGVGLLDHTTVVALPVAKDK